MKTLHIYWKLIGISLRSRMQFRADFLVGLISVIALNAINLATIGVLLNQFHSLSGWTIWEIVFLYSIWVLAHSIFSMLFWHMDDLEFYITQGTFDIFLLRPISPFIQFIGRDINYMGFADILVGITGLSIALENLRIQMSVWHWAYMVVIVLSGTIIEFSITLLLACVAFWTGRSSSSINTVMEVNMAIQRYPVDMYGRWFQLFVTCILPVAFINYYPAKLLLGKSNPGDTWYWLNYLSPFVAIFLLGISAKFWKRALKQYSSSGG